MHQQKNTPRFHEYQQLRFPALTLNNRLNSLENIIAAVKAGLLFLIPGFEQTLRVNGAVALSTAPTDIELATDEHRLTRCLLPVR
jgi:hypothetical protein